MVPPTPADPPPSSSAADAQKAAEEAHKAAQNATDIESAAQAAQQAVDAAQQAVDATVTQEAVLRQEALLSGNGEEMALTLSLCFSDPIYGIRSSSSSSSSNDPKNATTTKAFLYWDASYYFTAELVHPYVRVVPTTWTPPVISTPTVSAFSPDSSFVDWSLAMVILGTSLLGILLLIQRVSPHSSWRSQWLYKYQRWFFDPMHHNFDEEENEELRRRSESRPLGGQEGIPYSMGGGGAANGPSPLYVGGHFRKTRGLSKDVLYHHSSSGGGSDGAGLGDNGSVGGAGDVEMVAQQQTAGSVHGDALSDLGEDEFIDETSVVSSRLFRDPELVELPDLTSSSKVAVPVSLKNVSTGNFSID